MALSYPPQTPLLDTPLRQNQNARWGMPVLAAAIVHCLFLGAIAWLLQWRIAPTPAAVQAVNVELWSTPNNAPNSTQNGTPIPEPTPALLPSPTPPPEPPTSVPEQTHPAKPNIVAKQEKPKPPAPSPAQEQQQALRERLQQQQLERIGNAASSSPALSAQTIHGGVSENYAALVIAKVRPYIVFSDASSNSLIAEIEIQTGTGGRIMRKRLLQSSGSPQWDEAVLRALEKTETMPADKDGKTPGLMVLRFRPRD